MSEDRIAEIRKRHEDVAWRYIELPVIYEDRAFLLAEVDRLRVEIERTRASLKQFRCSCDPGECVEYGERWASVCEKGEARDVLEGKP